MSQMLFVSEFFKAGKMDADFEVRDGYVTGLCVLYAERSAEDREYMIREKSIVMLENRNLSECVQEAKDLAWQSALKRLSDMPAVTDSGHLRNKDDDENILPPKCPMKKSSLYEPEPDAEYEPEPETETELESDEATGAEHLTFPEKLKDDDDPVEQESPILSAAKQVGFADLRPASSLLKPDPQPAAEPDPEDEDEAYAKACQMKITILGKLHECNGWTAGQILEKRPDVILDFANRYNGPKTEEKEALRTLYTEAMRRANRAA